MNDNEIASAYFESIDEEMAAAGIEAQPIRPEGFGITIMEYARLKKCSESTARKSLGIAEKRGMLVSHRMGVGPGANSLVYCRSSEWPPSQDFHVQVPILRR